MPLSLISGLPFAVQLIVLTVLGIGVGVFCNWAIYSWAWFLYRPISPWQRPHEEASERQWLDYVPIAGWPGRARDQELFGKWFWLRPMLIEIAAAVFVPWFYFWLSGGGLLEDSSATLPEGQPWIWFCLFMPFVALLMIATFIDFDEHTIPDWITIPGTLFALVMAALFPGTRLPGPIASDIGGRTITWIDYLSPNLSHAPSMPQDATSLALLITIFLIWVWALLPKLSPFDVGWGRSIKFLAATTFRPRRKNKCAIRTTPRKMPGHTKLLFTVATLGCLAIFLAWSQLSTTGWESLTGSFFGLAFGGGMIWSIRIVGTMAMGRQAMGFGDVTLMAMIGATLGWQAALISFVFTIVLIVVFLIVQIIATGSQELAFGPYLCGGAIALIFFWAPAWSSASQGLFSLGVWLIYLLIAFPVLMFVMLLGVQAIKRVFAKPD